MDGDLICDLAASTIDFVLLRSRVPGSGCARLIFAGWNACRTSRSPRRGIVLQQFVHSSNPSLRGEIYQVPVEVKGSIRSLVGEDLIDASTVSCGSFLNAESKRPAYSRSGLLSAWANQWVINNCIGLPLSRKIRIYPSGSAKARACSSS